MFDLLFTSVSLFVPVQKPIYACMHIQIHKNNNPDNTLLYSTLLCMYICVLLLFIYNIKYIEK